MSMHAAPALPRRGFLLGLSAVALAGGRVALAAGPGDDRFVVLLLRGAMDGLAVVAPYGDPDHAGLRTGIALPEPGREGGLFDLGGFYGLHPALPAVASMFAANEAMFVHAVAGPHRTRSHFEGQDALESGAPNRLNDGWLNRAIAASWPADARLPGAQAQTASRTAPGMRHGLSIGPQVPLLLRGPAQVSAFEPRGGQGAELDTIELLAGLYAADPLLGPAFREGRAGRGFADDVLAQGHGPEANRPQARNAVGDTAFALGQLLADPNGPRVAAFELGGWDTHAFQAQRLAGALRNLDLALERLRAGLGAAWSRTVVVAMTEFGRTARVNGTQGTDHGTAGVAMVLGGSVQGGRVFADWPGLSDAQLFQGRDLAPTTDLRAVLKPLLARQLGLQPAALDQAVFPGSGGAQAIRGLLRA